MRTLTPALTRARSAARTSALTAAVCLTLLAAGVAAAPVTAQPEAVATFPSDQATENIVQAADGAIYVTGNADRVVWRVTPGGVVERWADLTGQSVILGVAMAPEGAVVTATARPVMRAPAPGATAAAPQLDLSDVGPRVLVLDTGGRVAATVEGQKGSLLNGITAGGPGWYLVADSGGG
ncbi:MAG: hypothetical protein Q7J25_08595, partial [Vicinamibacterales bacterium]|nr:hypothetical protein [Vicinamibacterales bacterium]